MSRSHKNWWADTPAAGKRAALGGGLLVVALVVTGAAVWASPGAADPFVTVDQQLAASVAENEALREELAAAEASAERARSAAKKAAASPSPTPTPTPTPAPTPTPEPVPDDGGEVSGPDTVVVYRDSPAQPRPAAPSTPAPAPVPAAVTAPAIETLISPNQRYFGMYTTQAPFNFATFDDAAMKAGSRQGMVGYFGGWDEPFRGDAVTRSWERGLVPMLTWESRPIAAQNDVVVEPDYSLPRIIGDPENGVAGAFDDYLRQYARDIVTTGLPLAIRLDHEMNGTWYPWAETKSDGTSLNGNSPGDFVTMWRHVHDIFEAEGANQFVIWTWSPNIVNNLPARNKSVEFLAALYPGDEYVDWVGVSGYLRPRFDKASQTWSYDEGQTWTFDYTFGRTLEQLRQISDKPIILTEIGASEIGAHKVEWVTDLFDAFTRPENADIIGFSWFNLAVTTISNGERVTNDWRIDSRADTRQAFQDGLADPAGNFALIPY